MALITDFITYDDIDLRNKLGNMLYSEISDEIFDKCLDENIFKKIEGKVWELINDKESKFSRAGLYEDLYECEAENECEFYANCMYNCDLLYMTAIAHVLGLKLPVGRWDTDIFGI